MPNSTQKIQYTRYGEDRFPAHLSFGPVGYFFTVSGSFPADTPANTNVTDSQMAVYRTEDGWEVRDVNGDRRVWGTGPTRAKAVDTAFAELYRIRRDRAARIADQRVNALGLEPVPPYAVETTHGLTLVLDPATVGILHTIEPAEFDAPGTAARYNATDLRTGGGLELPADGPVRHHPVAVGVLHVRCGHDPDDAARFENEQDATVYAREALTAWWPCPDNPAEPEHPALTHARTAVARAWPCADTPRWSAADE
jgi:hypothetical protein